MVVIIKCGHWVFKNLASSWNRIKRDWERQGSRKINGSSRNSVGRAGEQRRSSEWRRRRWEAGVRDHGGCGAHHELRPDGNQGRSPSGHLRLRLREALRHSAESGLAHHSGPRRHRSGPVRYRKNLHDCSHRLPDGRHFQPRVRRFSMPWYSVSRVLILICFAFWVFRVSVLKP